MFQLTPPYERRLAWLLPSAMAVLLVLWSAQAFAGTAEWQGMVFMAGMAIAAVYAGATLSLQARRRRKVSDPTLHFFRGAMLCLLVMAASGVWFEFDPRAGEQGRAAIWLGLLAIPGVFVSAISGMLYKILPFLNWLHLQQLGGPGSMPPNMREMIPERAMTAHMRLHFAAVFALLSSVLLPFLARPAGLLFAAACAWLGINLIRGVRAYVRFREAMQRGAPA